MPMLRSLGVTPVMGVICYVHDKNFWRVPKKDLMLLALLGVIVFCISQNLFNIGLQVEAQPHAADLRLSSTVRSIFSLSCTPS